MHDVIIDVSVIFNMSMNTLNIYLKTVLNLITTGVTAMKMKVNSHLYSAVSSQNIAVFFLN